jgi:hypothetical protein
MYGDTIVSGNLGIPMLPDTSFLSIKKKGGKTNDYVWKEKNEVRKDILSE